MECSLFRSTMVMVRMWPGRTMLQTFPIVGDRRGSHPECDCTPICSGAVNCQKFVRVPKHRKCPRDKQTVRSATPLRAQVLSTTTRPGHARSALFTCVFRAARHARFALGFSFGAEFPHDLTLHMSNSSTNIQPHCLHRFFPLPNLNSILWSIERWSTRRVTSSLTHIRKTLPFVGGATKPRFAPRTNQRMPWRCPSTSPQVLTPRRPRRFS